MITKCLYNNISDPLHYQDLPYFYDVYLGIFKSYEIQILYIYENHVQYVNFLKMRPFK
jgi:hypothetical protein